MIETYETSDLALTTALSIFAPIERIDHTDPKRAIFIFAKTPEFDAILEQYWRGELRVEPKSYFNQLRNMKARIYERQ